MSKKVIPGAVIAGNLVFTVGAGRKGEDVPTQIRNTLDELKSMLERAGSSFENVIFGLVFLSDLDNRERYLNDIWKEYFTNWPGDPMRACVQVGLGPIAVEIILIATISEK